MKTKGEAAKELIRLFYRNGCLRLPSQDRTEEGTQQYKKGWEIRFAAGNEDELKYIEKLLAKLDFKYGKPYAKSAQTIIPVYGRLQVEKFQALLKKKWGNES